MSFANFCIFLNVFDTNQQRFALSPLFNVAVTQTETNDKQNQIKIKIKSSKKFLSLDKKNHMTESAKPPLPPWLLERTYYK